MYRMKQGSFFAGAAPHGSHSEASIHHVERSVNNREAILKQCHEVGKRDIFYLSAKSSSNTTSQVQIVQQSVGCHYQLRTGSKYDARFRHTFSYDEHLPRETNQKANEKPGKPGHFATAIQFFWEQ